MLTHEQGVNEPPSTLTPEALARYTWAGLVITAQEADQPSPLGSDRPGCFQLVGLALEAEDPRVRLAACRDILDRVGLVELGEEVAGPDSAMTDIDISFDQALAEYERKIRNDTIEELVASGELRKRPTGAL